MKNIWLTTDTHFLHDNLIEYCGRPKDFSWKIFKGLSRIPDKDILIHLGDISLGMEKEVHEKFIKPLKCTKILVKGNHDRKSNNWYLSHSWDFVCYSFWDIYRKKKVVFSHFPVKVDEFDLNIFGHMHNDVNTWDRVNKEFKAILCKKHLLLAIENTGYQPVKLDYVIDKADKFRLVNILK